MIRILAVCVSFALVSLARADEAGKKMLKELEGDYVASSMTKGGDPAPDEFIKTISFNIKGDTFTVRFKKDDKDESHAAVAVIDSAQKPIAIDLTPKDGPDAGKPMLGIIKVEKGVITVCWNDTKSKNERPKEFSSTKENGLFLIVMKKK